ncbi:SGNH/GDSL hydrolase family protein [Rhodoglobus vestalii]|uniref:SGNH/GDSL hydrolase family protein n=1 Tax=Rhodoglobus vestalii TaxID=193384 RepID=UPI00248227F4|nr:SGNH/GDSL hydrolase family protein [Rhodoglobus vestalii]
MYFALGDSPAQGIGTATLDFSHVGLLGARLQRHSGRTVQVVNTSRYGAQLKDVIAEQLPLLDEYEPDPVTLSIGANDMRTLELDAFRALDVKEP